MAEASQCPHCGKPVPATALPGLCPECMLKAGAPTEEFGPGGTRVTGKPPHAPLSPAEIARHFPHLEILECLGRGGMGVVYRARQPQLDRIVALKILAPEKEHDPAFAERFSREAQALARLSHPNIVVVYDFGQVDGLYYLLMEYVDGMNLRQVLRAGSLKPEEALAIVPKICEALQFAHERGVVHRDIKPENVLLDKQGRLKIADFGIAKIMAGGQPSLTEEQQVIGTPHYMAPEQVEKPQTVDHRADIYSLGVVFYEMLTGELPIGKFSPPSTRMHGVAIDVRLDQVVLRALEKEPERRYQRAGDVKTAVEEVTSRAVTGGTPAAKEPADPRLRSYSRLALGLFLAGTLGTLVLMTLSHRHEMALILSAIALVLALIFGVLSWKQRLGRNIALTVIALFVLVGITAAVLSEVIPSPFAAQRAAAEEARARDAAALVLQRQQASKRVSQTVALPLVVPPVVIKTVPQSGSTNVNPTLSSLEVTFSDPMLDRSWAWCKWTEESFPELTGEPKYVDSRTCVLPVQLEAGKVYAIWLNSSQNDSFKNAGGVPAVPYLLIFETRK